MTLNTFPEFYPNPINKGDLLNIKNSEEKIYSYALYNYLGQIFRTGKLIESENTIDRKNLDLGIYFIHAFNSQREYTVVRKLIIN